jgi:hypothetical protein
LRAGLRFLPRPLPAAPSARLAAGLPSREGDGLTTLHRENPRGLGPALTPVARHLRRMSLQHPDLATYRFGPSLSAPLARLCLRRLRRFTWVGRTTRPWSPTAAVLAVATSARAPVATLAREDTLCGPTDHRRALRIRMPPPYRRDNGRPGPSLVTWRSGGCSAASRGPASRPEAILLDSPGEPAVEFLRKSPGRSLATPPRRQTRCGTAQAAPGVISGSKMARFRQQSPR